MHLCVCERVVKMAPEPKAKATMDNRKSSSSRSSNNTMVSYRSKCGKVNYLPNG